jgi:hypothetical protein
MHDPRRQPGCSFRALAVVRLSGAQVMVEDIAGEQLPASSSLSVSSSPLVIASHKRRTTG